MKSADDKTKGRALVKSAVNQLGSMEGLAAALQVHRATVLRWHSGVVRLHGAPLVAVLAVLAHPEDYAHHHRPRGTPGRRCREDTGPRETPMETK